MQEELKDLIALVKGLVKGWLQMETPMFCPTFETTCTVKEILETLIEYITTHPDYTGERE